MESDEREGLKVGASVTSPEEPSEVFGPTRVIFDGKLPPVLLIDNIQLMAHVDFNTGFPASRSVPSRVPPTR